MARFALYAYQRQGCRTKGEFDTLNEAKRALFEALDGDIESCETLSKFEIYDEERETVVFHFAQENSSEMVVEDLQDRIKALISDEGISNPYTLRNVAELCMILANKVEIAG